MKNHLSWLSILFLFNCFAYASTPEDFSTFQKTNQCDKCNLQGVNLSHFSSEHTNQGKGTECAKTLSLRMADLSHADLSEANLIACARGRVSAFAHIHLDGANLAHAVLKNSRFYNVSLVYANLLDAYLNNAQLDLTDFTEANFSHAHLNQAKSQPDAMHGWGSNFYLANFCGADLTGADLYGFFKGANFSMATLQHATFTSTPDAIPSEIAESREPSGDQLWSGVNFKGADLRGAHFYGVNQKPADITRATFCKTLMPDGHINNRDCGR